MPGFCTYVRDKVDKQQARANAGDIFRVEENRNGQLEKKPDH